MGRRIKAARERLENPKMRQIDVALAFEITPQAVSQWEKDEDRPDWQKMPKLARLLRIPLIWLMAGEGPPPAPDDPMVLFELIGDHDRLAVLDLMRSMAQRAETERNATRQRRTVK